MSFCSNRSDRTRGDICTKGETKDIHPKNIYRSIGFPEKKIIHKKARLRKYQKDEYSLLRNTFFLHAYISPVEIDAEIMRLRSLERIRNKSVKVAGKVR